MTIQTSRHDLNEIRDSCVRPLGSGVNLKQTRLPIASSYLTHLTLVQRLLAPALLSPARHAFNP